MQPEKLHKPFPVNILGNFLSPAEAVRNLSVWFNSAFVYYRHVMNICKSCFAQIWDLKCLSGYVGNRATHITVNALVGSQLYHYNSLFRSLSALDLHKLQRVQNSLATLLPTSPSIHTLLLLERLSIGCALNTILYLVLPALLVHKFLQSSYPKYFLNISLNLDIVCTIHVKAQLMVCC